MHLIKRGYCAVIPEHISESTLKETSNNSSVMRADDAVYLFRNFKLRTTRTTSRWAKRFLRVTVGFTPCYGLANRGYVLTSGLHVIGWYTPPTRFPLLGDPINGYASFGVAPVPSSAICYVGGSHASSRNWQTWLATYEDLVVYKVKIYVSPEDLHYALNERSKLK